MQLRRSVCIGIFCVAVIWASPSRASAPSEGCKTGAESCRAAYVAFNKCMKGKGATEDSCKPDKESADKACKSTTSVCHTDGSRNPPGHQ